MDKNCLNKEINRKRNIEMNIIFKFVIYRKS